MSELIGPSPDGVTFFEPDEAVNLVFGGDDHTFESREIQIGDLGTATLFGDNFWDTRDNSLSSSKSGLIITRDGMSVEPNIYRMNIADDLYEITIQLKDNAITTGRSSAVGHRASRMALACTMLVEGSTYFGRFISNGEDLEDFTWFKAWNELGVNPPTILTHPDPVVLSRFRFQFKGRMHLPQFANRDNESV